MPLDTDQNTNQLESKDKKHILGKAFFILITFCLLLLASLYYYKSFFNCDKEIKYSLGSIDKKFKLDANTIATLSQKAGEEWNTSLGKKIFVYDENASLKIDFVYDRRQMEYDKTKESLGKLDLNYNNLNELNAKVDSLLSKYNKELDQYNAEVSYWNKKGGAPENEYDKLNDWKERLDEQRKYINNLLNILNIQTENYNFNAEKINDEIREKQGKLVEEGLYSPSLNKIEIFKYEDLDTLKILLMHELGHAKGASHIEKENSIMNAVFSEGTKITSPTTEDIETLSKSCHY